MTYDELIQNIVRFTENDDSEAAEILPQIVSLAERDIADRLKGEHIVSVYEGLLLDPNEHFVNKPANLVRPLNMWVVDSNNYHYPIFKRTYSFCLMYDPVATADFAIPKFYADFDNDFFYFTPAPTDSISIELQGMFRIIGLTSLNQTTYLSINYPQLLLKSALRQFSIFDKNKDLYELYNVDYETELKHVEKEVKLAQVDFNALDNMTDDLYRI